MLEIFEDNAFGVVELTDAINDLAFVPGRISKSGLFYTSGITTPTAYIERKGARLALVSPTPRGAPGESVNVRGQRDMLPVNVPHFERNDAVMADEVSGVREFGTEDQLETVMGVVAEKAAEHSNDLAATTEHSQLGAIKGIITYADASVTNLFTTFGVTAPDDVVFDISTLKAGADDGAFRKWCSDMTRAQAAELQGLPWTGKTRVFVGDNLFDAILGNVEVRETYKGWTEAQILRDGYIEAGGESYGAFEFANCVFENYRGQVGATPFVATDEGHAFPEGVSRLFRTYHAPADYVETVNTKGRRLYAQQYKMQNNKGVHLDIQMNELNICTRPRVLRKITLQA